jgi:Ca-activated chloride channel family protein
MNFLFRFQEPWVLYLSAAWVVLVCILRYLAYRPVTYKHSLGNFIAAHAHSGAFLLTLHNLLRLLFLTVLALLVARPQWSNERHIVAVDGIDIVVALDVSGSMDNRDFADDERSRFEVARAEAIRFVQKRVNDAIGVVLFGADALSRCPLTVDKEMLERMLADLKLGLVPIDGTVIGKGMLTAANRLKNTHGKSKILILLTDGTPTPEHDIDIEKVLSIIKTLGIRVYTIGIGSEKQGYIFHPLYGYIPAPSVNKDLLTHIAHETGGQYFLVTNAADMRRIYDEIDKLETVHREVPLYRQWHDFYLPIIVAVLCLMTVITFLFGWVWCIL